MLEQNYPNPFNPRTTIVFGLNAPSHVRLEVFDVLGRRISRLIDAHYASGRHDVIWEAGGMPSGTYLYRITSGAGSETHRMTLVR